MVQVDPDEFIILSNGNTLPELLKQYDLSYPTVPGVGFRHKMCNRQFKNYPDLITSPTVACSNYCVEWANQAKLAYRPKLVNFLCHHITRDPDQSKMLVIADTVAHHNHYRLIGGYVAKPERNNEASTNLNFIRMQSYLQKFNETTYLLFGKEIASQPR